MTEPLLPDLPASGGCRCGRVRFRVTMNPLFTSACHCRGCQRMSASAYSLSAGIPDEGFEAIAGDTVPGGADHAFGHRFCPHCLTWVWTKHPMMQGFHNVRATMFDEPGWARPYMETWTATRLPFAETGAVRSFDGFPTMESLPGLMQDFAAWAKAGVVRQTS